MMENTCTWAQNLQDSQLTIFKIQAEPGIKVTVGSHFYLGSHFYILCPLKK